MRASPCSPKIEGGPDKSVSDSKDIPRMQPRASELQKKQPITPQIGGGHFGFHRQEGKCGPRGYNEPKSSQTPQKTSQMHQIWRKLAKNTRRRPFWISPAGRKCGKRGCKDAKTNSNASENERNASKLREFAQKTHFGFDDNDFRGPLTARRSTNPPKNRSGRPP